MVSMMKKVRNPFVKFMRQSKKSGSHIDKTVYNRAKQKKLWKNKNND